MCRGGHGKTALGVGLGGRVRFSLHSRGSLVRKRPNKKYESDIVSRYLRSLRKVSCDSTELADVGYSSTQPLPWHGPRICSRYLRWFVLEERQNLINR